MAPGAHGAEVTAHNDALEVTGVAVEDHHHLSMRRVALLKPVVHAEANRLVVVRDRARREDQCPLGNVYPEPGRRNQSPFSVFPQGGFYPVNGCAHGHYAPYVVICQHRIARIVSGQPPYARLWGVSSGAGLPHQHQGSDAPGKQDSRAMARVERWMAPRRADWLLGVRT